MTLPTPSPSSSSLLLSPPQPLTCGPFALSPSLCLGVTYKNQCFATLAGVSVATIGECPALASGGSKGPTIPLLKSLQDAAAKSTEERKDGGRLNESAAVAMAFFGDHAKLSHTQGGNSSSLPPEPSSTLAYANSMLQLMAQAGGTNDTYGTCPYHSEEQGGDRARGLMTAVHVLSCGVCRCGADQGGCPSGYYCAYPQGQCGAAHTAVRHQCPLTTYAQEQLTHLLEPPSLSLCLTRSPAGPALCCGVGCVHVCADGVRVLRAPGGVWV